MIRIENDNECLLYMQQGRQEALSYLIEIYFPVLCKYAITILDNSAEAEDITIDVFIKIWDKKNDFKSFNELKSFIYTSVKNACLNQLRSRKRENIRHQLFTENQPEKIDEFLYQEMLIKVRTAIHTLPKKMQQIFILSYFNKMTNEEIAQHLALSQQTVRNQKVKALKILRNSMKDKLWFIVGIIMYCIAIK